MMKVQDPQTVGFPVHYVSRGSADGVFPPKCRAATITEVTQPTGEEGVVPRASLAVLNPTGLFFDQDLPYDVETQQGGSWHPIVECHGNPVVRADG